MPDCKNGVSEYSTSQVPALASEERRDVLFDLLWRAFQRGDDFRVGQHPRCFKTDFCLTRGTVGKKMKKKPGGTRGRRKLIRS